MLLVIVIYIYSDYGLLVRKLFVSYHSKEAMSLITIISPL